MATHGIVTHYDGRAYTVTMGLGEDVAAPRHIAALVKAGWPEFDTNQTSAIKAWLAGRREQLIDRGIKFEEWADTVRDLELLPDRTQIEAALAGGAITPPVAEVLLEKAAAFEAAQGEAAAPPAL